MKGRLVRLEVTDGVIVGDKQPLLVSSDIPWYLENKANYTQHRKGQNRRWKDILACEYGIQAAWDKQIQDPNWEIDGYYVVIGRVTFGWRKREKRLKGHTRWKRIDADATKSVLDALQGRAYRNDNLVIFHAMTKDWWENEGDRLQLAIACFPEISGFTWNVTTGLVAEMLHDSQTATD